MNIVLWILQVLLAVLFLLHGYLTWSGQQLWWSRCANGTPIRSRTS